MSYDNVSKESLDALAKVHVLCNDLHPCRKAKCKRCQKRDEGWQRLMEATDIEFENKIWGGKL